MLYAGGIFPAAVSYLTDARNLIAQAQLNTNPSQRRTIVNQAIAKLGQAKGAVATIAP